MKKEIITDEERLGSEVFNALVAADFAEEMKKPLSITVYLPSCYRDIETYFDSSAPHYMGHP